MWRRGRVVLILVAVHLFFTSAVSAQPALPITELPKGVAPEVAQRVKRLYSPLPGERIAAIIELGDLGEKAAPAVPFLLALWDDAVPVTMKTTMSGGVTLESTEYPRWQAVKAFGRIGKPAVAPLIAALKNEKEMIRRIAAQGLGAIKDIRAIEPLVLAAQHADYGGVDAMESLRKITGQNFQTPVAWANWWEENSAKIKTQ